MQEHRDLKPEEILQLAAEEGYELTDEELESVAGGDVDGGKVPVRRLPSFREYGQEDQKQP